MNIWYIGLSFIGLLVSLIGAIAGYYNKAKTVRNLSILVFFISVGALFIGSEAPIVTPLFLPSYDSAGKKFMVTSTNVQVKKVSWYLQGEKDSSFINDPNDNNLLFSDLILGIDEDAMKFYPLSLARDSTLNHSFDPLAIISCHLEQLTGVTQDLPHPIPIGIVISYSDGGIEKQFKFVGQIQNLFTGQFRTGDTDVTLDIGDPVSDIQWSSFLSDESWPQAVAAEVQKLYEGGNFNPTSANLDSNMQCVR